MEILAFFGAFLISHYPAVIVHELGHVFAFFVLRIPLVRIKFGNRRVVFSFKIKKVVIDFCAYPDGGECTRKTEPHTPAPSALRMFLVFASGIMLNLLLGIALYACALGTKSYTATVLLGVSLTNLNLFILNVLPVSLSSDGRRAAIALMCAVKKLAFEDIVKEVPEKRKFNVFKAIWAITFAAIATFFVIRINVSVP